MENFKFLENLIEANPAEFISLIGLLVIWSLVWKGLALWKAARLTHKGWFITLLILNTAGILEIIYIFAIAKKKENPKNPQITDTKSNL